MNWKSRLGFEEDQRKHVGRADSRRPPLPEGMTEVVIIDKVGAVIVSLELSFAEIQSEAEAAAGAHGNPIASMVTLVRELILDEGAELTDAGLKRLQATAAQVAVNPGGAKRLELRATRVQRTTPAPATGSSQSLP